MKVERAIKILLRDLYPHRAQRGRHRRRRLARRVPGVRERHDRIFEIRSYSRTLNNGQKRNIERSLRAALTHVGVSEWVLIMPHDHTPDERDHLEHLITELKRDHEQVGQPFKHRDALHAAYAAQEPSTNR